MGNQDERAKLHSVEAYAVATLKLHGLDLSKADRVTVIANVKSIADAAKLVNSYPLTEEIESAVMFRVPQ